MLSEEGFSRNKVMLLFPANVMGNTGELSTRLEPNFTKFLLLVYIFSLWFGTNSAHASASIQTIALARPMKDSADYPVVAVRLLELP